jgi:predicted dithiol-disulfide oxidoreductase (DUF899 family)
MKIVDQTEWLVARRALLEQEKAFTRDRDALSAARRAMPVVPVTVEYSFQTETGPATLQSLFGPHNQLVIYHFMFGPDWQAGCKMCSFWADSFDRVGPHLAARDTAFFVTSNGPLDRLLAYRARMGWSFPWISTGDGPFHRDFATSFPGSDVGYNYSGRAAGPEMPGLSVFVKLEDGGICHSYSTYARGLDMLNTAYQLLDLTPLGRQEDALDFKMSWVRRHDEYSANDTGN